MCLCLSVCEVHLKFVIIAGGLIFKLCFLCGQMLWATMGTQSLVEVLFHERPCVSVFEFVVAWVFLDNLSFSQFRLPTGGAPVLFTLSYWPQL